MPYKEDRKSQSPPIQAKSTISYAERKHVSFNATKVKSHYTSKTNRELTSEMTTERDRNKPKSSKVIKKPKADQSKKLNSKSVKKI